MGGMTSLIVFGTLGYCVATFPYAFVWHLVLFKDRYERWQYMGSSPKPVIGLLSMVIQGTTLSAGYALLPSLHSSFMATFCFVALCGVFGWSFHVVAAMAKHEGSRNAGFFFLESFYLSVQFLLFAFVLFGIRQFV